MAKSTITEKINTTLGKCTIFSGTMRFTKSLKIDGSFEGDILSESGFLFIDESAVVKADVKARSIVIGGTVEGNVIATEKLELLPTGKVLGNIRTSSLRIADGVSFAGNCEMIKNPEQVDIFSAPLSKIKKIIQSV
ncbi:MAG: polymer-forming cytoskeletal protein [Spirochaetales bacterium]|jgi:cytoskeletal protein CcmA (bactofilin family)|nr:polymer-forming cytoskeletal protein [Spirochaetales bacterium]